MACKPSNVLARVRMSHPRKVLFRFYTYGTIYLTLLLRQYVSNVLALLLTRCRSFGYIEVFPRHIQHFHIKTLTNNGLHPCRPSLAGRIPKGT